MTKFTDWLIAARESSAFTRLRWNAALGLAPPIPDASMHSRSTASPWMVEKTTKKKKKKKKKSKKNESSETLAEAKIAPVKHVEIDGWLGEVDKLKGALKALKDAIAKKKKEKPEIKQKPEEDKNKLGKIGDEKDSKEKEKEKDSDKDVVAKIKPSKEIVNDDRNIERTKRPKIELKVDKKTGKNGNNNSGGLKK